VSRHRQDSLEKRFDDANARAAVAVANCEAGFVALGHGRIAQQSEHGLRAFLPNYPKATMKAQGAKMFRSDHTS
jgi:hypothetical protein